MATHCIFGNDCFRLLHEPLKLLQVHSMRAAALEKTHLSNAHLPGKCFDEISGRSFALSHGCACSLNTLLLGLNGLGQLLNLLLLNIMSIDTVDITSVKHGHPWLSSTDGPGA